MLIRFFRFHIHSYNAEAMLKCIFPYYGTNLFVRMFQLLDTKHLAEKWKDIAEVLVSLRMKFISCSL